MSQAKLIITINSFNNVIINNVIFKTDLDIVKNELDELEIWPYLLSSPRWSAVDKTLKQVPIKIRGKLNPDLDVSFYAHVFKQDEDFEEDEFILSRALLS